MLVFKGDLKLMGMSGEFLFGLLKNLYFFIQIIDDFLEGQFEVRRVLKMFVTERLILLF